MVFLLRDKRASRCHKKLKLNNVEKLAYEIWEFQREKLPLLKILPKSKDKKKKKTAGEKPTN